MVLLPRDTKGTPKGAREAALSALEAGATLLLGPVYSSSVLSVAPIAASVSVNMIAFKIAMGGCLSNRASSNQLKARLAFHTLIVTTAADLQDPAHNRNRKLLSMFFDPGVLHSDSLAKYAAAFAEDIQGRFRFVIPAVP